MRTILGVRFLTGDVAEVVACGLGGGLVVVPSASVLVAMADDPVLRRALLESDHAVTDSGLMILLWRLFTGERLRRVSGLEYLQVMLTRSELREPGATFWVMPSVAARDSNLCWLVAQGFPVTAADCHVAPLYPEGEIEDLVLLKVLERRRPAQVILCVGGGVQERLGLFLRDRLTYRPGIHCIGAAIGFLTGDQFNIPSWADRYYLGWFFRCCSAPRRFIPRYWKALRLVLLMWRNRRATLPGRF